MNCVSSKSKNKFISDVFGSKLGSNLMSSNLGMSMSTEVRTGADSVLLEVVLD